LDTFQVETGNNSKEETQGFHSDNRRVDFFVVEAFDLAVTTCTEPSFVAGDIPIGISLDAEHPFVLDGSSSWR